MSIEQQLIFLFSALGAINGFLVSGYFLFKQQDKRLSDYFLGGLLLMLSVRIIKSVFLFFNKGLFEWFIHMGLTACFLIGPFLFLYVRSTTQAAETLRRRWWWHVLPYVVAINVFRYFYVYGQDREMWRWFVKTIYHQWLLYILLSAYVLRGTWKQLWQRDKPLSDEAFWQLSIFVGTTVIWAAYYFSSYTSYIVGALSFTFLGYVSALLWLYKKSSKKLANDLPLKYANSTLSEATREAHWQILQTHLTQQKIYLDANLTLSKLSEQLKISRKELSQVINQTTGQNYSSYIALLRIQEAQRLLQQPEYATYKIAAIAYESGFNSLSSFNTHFKKIVGETPHQYRKRTQYHDSGSQKHDFDRK